MLTDDFARSTEIRRLPLGSAFRQANQSAVDRSGVVANVGPLSIPLRLFEWRFVTQHGGRGAIVELMQPSRGSLVAPTSNGSDAGGKPEHQHQTADHGRFSNSLAIWRFFSAARKPLLHSGLSQFL